MLPSKTRPQPRAKDITKQAKPVVAETVGQVKDHMAVGMPRRFINMRGVTGDGDLITLGNGMGDVFDPAVSLAGAVSGIP